MSLRTPLSLARGLGSAKEGTHHWWAQRLTNTSVLSITHRGTGVFLSLGALFLCYWLLAIASGPESYANLQNHINAWYGQILFWAWVFSLYYHLCNEGKTTARFRQY